MTHLGVSDPAIEAVRQSLPDPVGLLEVLDLVSPGAVPTEVTRLVGGLGSSMHRIDIRTAQGGSASFVLRRYLTEWGHTGEIAFREALTLDALRGSGVTAPEMLWVDPEGRVFDRPALAMTLLPGSTRLPSGEAPETRAWAEPLADALVDVHAVDPDVVSHLPTTTLDQQVEKVRRHDGAPKTSPHLDADALNAAIGRLLPGVSPGRQTLIHGDFHNGNTLRGTDGVTVTGVVDWPFARIGDPRADAVYAEYDTTLVAGPDAAAAFRRRYEDRTGGPIADHAFWALLAVSASLPDPADWLGSWTPFGSALTAEAVRERAAAFLATALAETAR